jgi:carbon monoxide dehydrogenase subunit G
LSTTIEKTLRVEAPVAAAWKILADFAAISRWAPGVDHSSWASETREGVGAVRRVQAGRVALLETVVEWRPDELLSYRLTGLPPAAGTVTNTWRLAADGDGTVVTLTTRIEPLPGPPGRVVARVLGRQLAKADVGMLAGLAAFAGREEEK